MSSTILKRDALCLHKYQENAASFIIQNKACWLCIEMGLGKTVITLSALNVLMNTGEVNKCLVIAPLRVCKTVWPAEVKKWGFGLRVSVVTGSKAAREKALRVDADIYVINKENAAWICEYYEQRFPFDMVVLDESQTFKSSKVKRFKALKKVRHLFSRCVLLSGTPAPRSLLDVWSQMWLIDRGDRLGRTFSQYRNRYFTPDYWGYNWDLKPGADKAIHGRIEDVTLTLLAKDYLDMPPVLYNRVEIDLPPATLKLYEQLESQYVLEIDDETVSAVNAAVLTNKLLQLANGSLYVDGGRVKLHSAKVDALKEIIESNPGKSVLVATNFKFDTEEVLRNVKGSVKLDHDPKTEELWNSGKIDVLVANPASCGHGLNLQQGGSIVIWYGLTWSLELYQQFNARLHRQGQKETTVIHHIVCKDTIDEAVLASLQGKDRTQTALLEYLRKVGVEVAKNEQSRVLSKASETDKGN